MARIFLIDDQPTVRRGMKQLLTRGAHTVCGEAGSGDEALERIEASGADMALLDLSFGKESGLDLIAGLRELGIAVLLYSEDEDTVTISRAFAAGANGYVTKREVGDHLLIAVSDLLAGRRHVSPQAAQSLANSLIGAT